MTLIPETDRTRRNFRLGVLNGVLYISAETLLDPTLVLVAFLSHLTQSSLLLGMVVPLRDGSWSLPQLWVSGYLQSIPHKLTLYRRLSILRMVSWGLLALTICFIRSPQILLVAFFVSFALGSLASGLSGLPFMEVVSKTIPAHRRGEFFAWRLGLGGLLGVGGSALVRWMLDPASSPFAWPYNFGFLSALFWALASISLLAFNAVEEDVDTAVLARASFVQQVRRASGFLRIDKNFRRFVTLQSLMMVAGCATPFFAVYVQRSLGGQADMVGTYLLVLTITNLLSNALFGRVSLRQGNRKVMILAIVAGMLVSLSVLALVFLAGPLRFSGLVASWWLAPVFVLWGLRGTGASVAGNSLLLDIVPAGERSVYIGFYNSFLGVILLSTSLSGVIFDWFGFPLLVGLTLLAHLGAFVLILRTKTTPYRA